MDIASLYGSEGAVELATISSSDPSFVGAEAYGEGGGSLTYWQQVDNLIATHGGARWKMEEAALPLACSVAADALDTKNGTGTPTFEQTFTSYPTLKGVLADNNFGLSTAGGVSDSWATTGDFTHISVATIPASFGTGQCMWEVDGSGAGSGISASWGRLVFDTSTAAKIVWEDSGGTQRTANFTLGAGSWSSEENFFVVTHDSTSRTWTLYHDVSGTITVVDSDTYLAGQGPSGGVASNKDFGIMRRPTTGTNYMDAGWVIGANARITTVLSSGQLQTLLTAARAS